jgi:hypothetical protein
MLNNLLRKSFTFGIVVLLFGIRFTSFSLSSSVNDSNITTNDSDILNFLSARLIWDDQNIDYEYSSDYSYGDGWEGPLGVLWFFYALEVNCSLLLLEGTINVKPYNNPSLTLYPGDRISMVILFYYAFGYYYHELWIGRAFDVTIEKA